MYSLFNDEDWELQAPVKIGGKLTDYYQFVYVHFKNRGDFRDFKALIKDQITPNRGIYIENTARPNSKQDDPTLFNLDDISQEWEKHWKGMPEFYHKDLTPKYTSTVYFTSKEKRDYFSKVINQKLTDKTKSLWYPQAEIDSLADKCYISTDPQNPKYPIYIVSKGRWENTLTSKALDAIGVPYYVVIESHEYKNYRRYFSKDKLLILDQSYKDNYETCDDLGDSKSKGPGPARNFAWDHAILQGYARHWVMDDNIKGFFRFNRNLKVPVGDGTILRVMEDFVDRYKNIAMSGPNYFMFASRKTVMPALYFNTRIYSCNLIKNDTPYQWRGRYNEDTLLSLDILSGGLCTVEFNAFLQYKIRTQTIKGGNTDEFYAKEGTLPKSQMLANEYPNIAEVVWKWGRWHHHVDYSVFKRNELKRKEGVAPSNEPNEFGMQLQVVK